MAHRTASGARIAACGACVCALLLPGRSRAQQDMGHKMLGTAGLRAGAQLAPGVYIADRLVAYSADEIVDRHGQHLDVGLDSTATAGAIGVKAVVLLPVLDTHLGFTLALPVARVHVDTLKPLASVDRFGLGDLYVQPLQLGWRFPYLDVVTGYGLYVPTGRYEPRGGSGVGRGHATHQISLGSAVYFDRAKTWHLSALASYDINLKKRDIDVTRGESIQIQGGAGTRLFRLFDVGLVGYALWQVGDDRGSDLPPVLAGARDRALGLGGEAGVLIPPMRGQLSIRYVRDLVARSRPLGEVFVLSFTVALGNR